jgi:glycogen debranching enzyme
VSITAYEGPCFVLVAPNGDIPTGQEHGLYYEDTRFLSMHTMRLDGTEPVTLSARTEAPHLAVHFLTNAALSTAPRGALVIRRSYAVSHGLHGDLEIVNYGNQPVSFELALAYDADFEDIFQIKRSVESKVEAMPRGATHAASFGKAVLALSSADRGWSRRTEALIWCWWRAEERGSRNSRPRWRRITTSASV